MTTNMDDKELIAALDDAAKWLATSRFSGHEINSIEVCSVVCVAKERLEALQSPADAGVVTDEMVERAFVAHTAAKGMRLDPGAKYTANKLHMRTALEAALTTPKPEAVGDQCDKCHRRYTAVYNVPNDLWTKIAPKPETLGDYPEHQYGGLLCPDCATDAAKALGVELVLVTQPPTPASGEQMEDDDAVHELYLDALAEVEKAMRKFPQPNYVISKVAEEAGEVVKAAIHCAEGRETHAALVGEIRQAMAMLIRLYIEGDQVHGLASPLAALQQKEAER